MLETVDQELKTVMFIHWKLLKNNTNILIKGLGHWCLMLALHCTIHYQYA